MEVSVTYPPQPPTPNKVILTLSWDEAAVVCACLSQFGTAHFRDRKEFDSYPAAKSAVERGASPYDVVKALRSVGVPGRCGL
jgi:hypothetical protein